MNYGAQTVSDLGEKAIIESLLRPLFNPGKERNSIGDDCAALEVPSGVYVLVSTDRVPADLIAFKTSVITYRELGRYLGALNLSDIAACGGVPTGLLFNCGLPGTLLIEDLIAISVGLQEVVTAYGAKIVGGDITASSELSLSATVVGYVEQDIMLRRSGARRGGSVFVSREIGLTPVALDYCLNRVKYDWMSAVDKERLEAQFKQIPGIATWQGIGPFQKMYFVYG